MDRITLDLTNAMSDAVGPEHGISTAELSELHESAAQALASVEARREEDLRWMDLPYAHEIHDEVIDYAASVAGRFKNVVVLGIGGSALGNTALHAALSSPFHDLAPPPGLPRLFVLDNVDPDLVGEWLDHFDPAETLFNVISKSGGTAETMSQFLLFRERLVDALGEEAHREHIVVTTDAEKGILREIIDREGYQSFVVPDGVGGRFSVLSPVGLLSSALVGIDIKGVLAGAASMDEHCKDAPFEENPALTYACMQWLMQEKKSKNVAVTFSYSHRLRALADWYAQLLAESIGKRTSRSGEVVHRGPTPVRAVGVTDQHSQAQLYIEGPYDKWFTLLSVTQPDHAVPLPSAYPDLEGAEYLAGRDLGELFTAEREGTRVALTEAGRPNISIVFPRVDARSVGQYLMMMELAVAVMGELYDVDAFDQPGVEAGKIAAYALMGRAGYEARRAEIEGAGPAERKTI